MALQQEKIYTINDIYALPDGQRAELIDGQIYMMAPPNRIHQKLVMEMSGSIREYIRDNSGGCEVYPAPFAVFLNADDKNYVEPDISIICDQSKLDERGCNGAPDWIINPMKKSVMVYDLEHNAQTNQYNFDDLISVSIYKDLNVKIADLLA